MTAMRLHNERQFHDRQAAERARALTPRDYVFADEKYLQHETWITPAFDMLGDVAGKRVLDLGCGHGMASVVLARRGAVVTACDLSLGYVREAHTRANANRIPVRLLVCNGERLPFADGCFDRIWGNAILHHLDLETAAREIYRVLSPTGCAVFCEPWGGNRLLEFARRTLPYAGKERTADEAPLRPGDLGHLQAVFRQLQVRGFQLLTMMGRVFPARKLRSTLGWCDETLLRKWPAWQRYCRYVVLCLQK